MALDYALMPISGQAQMHMHFRFNRETMNTLGSRVKESRQNKKLSQARLGELAGIDQTVISKIERGDVQETSRIAELAHALDVSALWLATGKGEMRPKLSLVQPTESIGSNVDLRQKMPLRGRVPLISLVAAGNWSEAVNNLEPGISEEWVETTVQVKSHTYALRVEGDSMEPRFPHGAIIIVEPEEEAKNRSFVIVRQNGDEATFKQLILDCGEPLLMPLNPRYPPMKMQRDAVICGVVKQMIMDV